MSNVRPLFAGGPCAVTVLVHDPAVVAYSGLLSRGSTVQFADPSDPESAGYRVAVDGACAVTLSLVNDDDFPGGGDTWSIVIEPVAGLTDGATLADISTYGIDDWGSWSLTPQADGVDQAAFTVADDVWSPDPYALSATRSVGATLVWGGV